jgi:DNA primase small subunit
MSGRERKLLSEGDTSQRFEFLKSKFAEYYGGNLSSMRPPPSIIEREFGFLLFRERIMVRHRAFRDFESFTESLMSLIPSDVYYSTAYYEHPDLEMDRKGWRGSDVVFDVDADHIDTRCKETHDMWICPKCKVTRRGKKPVACPKCGYNKLDEKTWLCDRCLIAAKEEVLKLIEFLAEDFGIRSEEMHLFFSGHRGYHLHLISEKLKTLDEIQRKEIVDYVIALGLDPAEQGLYQDLLDDRFVVVVGPELTQPGWRGRLARGIYQILTESKREQLLDLGFTRGATDQILSDRESIKNEWSRQMLWSSFQDKWKIDETVWKNITEKALDLVALPARIDTVVTTDIHRLIRMPGTLNGKTGLRATDVDLDEIESFDPFSETTVFDGTQKIHVDDSPEVRIWDRHFGPFVDETVEVPLAVAVLLVAKGVAIPVK